MKFSHIFLVFFFLYIQCKQSVCTIRKCWGKEFPNLGFIEPVNWCSLIIGKCHDPREVHSRFLFYTIDNRDKPFVVNYKFENLEKAPFLRNAETVIMTHGFTEAIPSDHYENAKDLYIRKYKRNVILVDWSDGSQWFYGQSVANTKVVGKQIAFIVKKLNELRGLNPKKLTLRGFSLGAQIMGVAGRTIAEQLSTKVKQIVAEDPAGPCFDGRLSFLGIGEKYISTDDADLVQVYHTNAGVLGSMRKSGHYDYYFNGGTDQIGCQWSMNMQKPKDIIELLSCSHSRVTKLTEIDYSSHTDCQPVAYQCSNFDDFMQGMCASCDDQMCSLAAIDAQVFDSNNRDYQLSIPSPPLENRKYFLKTSAMSPFCEYHFQVIAYTSSSSCKLAEIILNGNNMFLVNIARSDRNKMTALLTVTPSLVNYKNPAPFENATLREASNCEIHKIDVNYMSNVDKRYEGCLKVFQFN